MHAFPDSAAPRGALRLGADIGGDVPRLSCAHSGGHMNNTLKTMLGVAGLIVATQAAAQVTFYEREGFRGRSFDTDRPVGNFERFGFNDRAASAVVQDGAWEVCEDARFSGRCVVLQPGRYESL